MRLKVGQSIDRNVVYQFQDRQKVNSDQALRPQYAKLNARTPYIRMSSLVRIKPGSNTALQYPGSEGWGLAKANVLGNDNSIFEGAVGYKNTPSLGIRPISGITNMNIVSHNRFGSVRTAVVSFACWSVEELDRLELLFMRPGFSVLLEWGHSVYIKRQGNSNLLGVESFKEVNSIDPYKGGELDIDTLWNSIYEKKKNTSYNYDGIVGIIKNFSWSFRPDGGYDCTVSLVTQGDLLESHKANLFVPQSQIEEQANEELQKHMEETNSSGSFDASFYFPGIDDITNPIDFKYTGVGGLGGHRILEPVDENKVCSLSFDVHPYELATTVTAGKSILITERLQQEGATVTLAQYDEFAKFLAQELNKAPDTVSTVKGWDKSKLKVVGPGVQVRSTKRGLFTTYIEKDYDGTEYDESVQKVPTAANPNLLCNPKTKGFAVPAWIFAPDGDDYGKIEGKAIAEVFDNIFGKGNYTAYNPIYSTQLNILGVAENNEQESVDSKDKFKGIFYGMETSGLILNYMYARRARYVVIYLKDTVWEPGTTTTAKIIEADENGVLPPTQLGVPATQAYVSQLHWELLQNFREKYISKVGDAMGPAPNTEVFSGTYLRARTADVTSVDLKVEKYPADAYHTTNFVGGTFQGLPKTDQDSGGLLAEVYIDLGNLLGVLNRYVMRSGDRPLFRFYTNSAAIIRTPTETEEPPRYFTFKDHLSVDPTICLLPHTLGDSHFQMYSGESEPYINRIKVGVSFILGILNNYISNSGSATMLEFLEEILAGISRVCGGVNELELQYSEPDRVYAIVDRRALGKTKHSDLLEVNLMGLDSAVKNVNMISKISSKMSSMVAISAQDSAFSSSEEATGFAALSKDLEDGIFRLKQDDYSKIKAETEEERLKAFKDQQEQDILDLARLIRATGRLYIDGILVDEKDLLAGQYENYCKRVIGRADSPANNFIIPFEMQLTVDGISGFGIMEAFKINKKVLPYTYGRKASSKIGFLVTGIEHNLNNTAWNTTIKSQIFNMDEEGKDTVLDIDGILTRIKETERLKKEASGPGSTKNLDKGWEGKEQAFKRTVITYAEAVAGIKKVTTNTNLQKAILAVMIREQGSGGAIKGFNYNFGGYDITSGGWSYSSFGETISNGYVYATEGGTGIKKAFVSFVSFEAFMQKKYTDFQKKGFDKASNAEECAKVWYAKWNGYGARALWRINKDGLKSKYPTEADYDAYVLKNFESTYNTAVQAFA